MKSLSKRSGRGSALVVTLPVLAILLLLIVMALVIVTSESRQASSAFDRQRAVTVSRIAVDEVAAKLGRIPLDKHWAAAPGLIRYWDGNDWNQTIPLHSGTDAADPADPDQQTNLNQRLADGSQFILPANDEYATAPEMKVDWRYLLDDGSIVSPPLAANQNPVGRFAYWVDLENARVNINTAGFGMTKFDYHLADTPLNDILADYDNLVRATNPWMTDRVTFDENGPTFPPLDRTEAQRHTPQNLTAHPSSIDLKYLEDITEGESFNTFRYAGAYFLRVDALNSAWKVNPADAREVNRYEPPAPGPDTTIRFFNTPEDWQMIVGREKYAKNKGYITTRGRTPEINPWGLPKMVLSEMSSEGNSINDFSLQSWRTYAGTIGTNDLNKANFGYEYTMQDTRQVQVPPLRPASQSNYGQRDNIRDLSQVYETSSRLSTYAGLLSALEGVFDTPVPGFTGTIWSNHFPTPAAGQQFGVDFLTYLDNCLNGISTGLSALSPWATFGNRGGHRRLGSYSFESSTGDENRKMFRVGTPGQFLINELVLQAEPVFFADRSIVSPPPPHGSEFGSVAALYASLPNKATEEQILDYLTTVNEREINNPKPKAVFTKKVHDWGNVIVYFIRELRDDDYFIRVRLTPELMAGPHYALRHGGLRSIGEAFQFSFRNNGCSWVSDDPDTGSGSMFMNFGNDFTSVRDDCRKLDVAGLTHATAVPSATEGNHYGTPNISAHTALLIGPFKAGTTVSSLRIRLHFTANFSLWGGWVSNNRRFITIPGTADALDAYEEGASPGFTEDETRFYHDIEDKLLEFEFTNIDTTSPIARFASKELIDPRLGREKEDWIDLAPDDHTLGDENESYAQSIASGADPSDLARPPGLLQAIRGRIRQFSYAGGDPRNRVERQNASLILGLPGVGYLSSVPTGVETNTPWQTFRFDNTASQGGSSPPDWLLWNLMYVPFDRSLANQTDGKLNLNATLYPFGIKRTRPLEALLGGRVGNGKALAANIADGPATPGLPTDLFVYNGQICDIAGIADTGNEYEREALPRDLADIVTTQCDDYRVFVVAESVRRLPNGRIVPMATQRSEVTLSRRPDGGPNGYYFGESDSVSNKSYPFYRRGEFNTGGYDATRYNAYDPADRDGHKSPMGADQRPNTEDDWLLPQRIDISSYRNVY